MKLSSLTTKSIQASFKYIFAYILSLKESKDIWIISERPNQARDNGYVFFKYMREYHKDIPVYYLIDKHAQDYQKIKEYDDRIIQFDSLKHYIYYCASKVHISAHTNGCCPSNAIGISRRTKHKLGFKDIFLPHGVSYGISEFCLKKYTDINLFICSGKPEYDNILNNYGYSKDEVVYTGFPRLDLWHDIEVNSKQIVLMPTWRSYLSQDNNLVFKNTKYYKEYNALINNKDLDAFLVKNDLNLIFYLHDGMQKYADAFSTTCTNINIVYYDDSYDIQELLKSSVLLITDYSSVHFDFAYMNKPVIYYQFDQKEFFERQYQHSWFSAEKNGFGRVVYKQEEVVKEIENLYSNQFKVEDVYHNYMRDFYQLYDNHNCDRVYEAIVEKLTK